MKQLGVFCLAIAFAAPAFAQDFEAGQRWSCITDQGAEAFMQVNAVDDGKVDFSWGAVDPGTGNTSALCGMIETLDAGEFSEFCKLLGEEFSEGHVLLTKECADG